MTGEDAAPEVQLVHEAAQVRSLLDPLRRDILARLVEPGSATSVAQALDLPRQRVNYHVRELEKEGLLRHVEDRRRGNCVERVVRASARRYLVDPAVAGTADPGDHHRPPSDPFSSAGLLSSAARSLREVGTLHGEAQLSGRRLPTLSLESAIHFRSPQHEVEFAHAIHEALARLTDHYHDPDAAEGRTFRVTVAGHPVPHRSVPLEEESR